MERPKLVLSLLNDEQDFQTLQAADGEQTAALAGFDLVVHYARNNSRLQLEQLVRYVHVSEELRPVAILVHPVDAEELARVAYPAVQSGIGWVLLNRDASYMDDLRQKFPSLPISVVTMDQVGIGRIQGRQFRSILPNGGNLLYLQGRPDSSSTRLRLSGISEAIADSKITLTLIDGDWTEASGEKAMLSWLRKSVSDSTAVDLIGAQNDSMAIGARKAIAASRPEWLSLPLMGSDGLPDGGQRMVKAGEFAATITVPSAAGPAIELIAKHLRAATRGPRLVVLPGRPYPDL